MLGDVHRDVASGRGQFTVTAAEDAAGQGGAAGAQGAAVDVDCDSAGNAALVVVGAIHAVEHGAAVDVHNRSIALAGVAATKDVVGCAAQHVHT